jgi:hypothetical protein
VLRSLNRASVAFARGDRVRAKALLDDARELIARENVTLASDDARELEDLANRIVTSGT